MSQYTDDEHIVLGKILKKRLMLMMEEKWDGEAATFERMATDIMLVFHEVSTNIDRYLYIDPSTKPN